MTAGRDKVLYGTFLVTLLFLLGSCSQGQVTPRTSPRVGFYHWEQQLRSSQLNDCYFPIIGTRELFVKCFDVVWADNQPAPRALLDFAPEPDSSLFIHPVVFLTNEVLRSIHPDSIPPLAANIVTAIERRIGLRRSNVESSSQGVETTPPNARPRTWQLDCDWTRSTQENYFALLREVRLLIPVTDQLSATVRLHQYLNWKAQGIPPVDRGLLMTYNVGELDRWETSNSILDTNITRQYLRPDLSYPLPLDLALPFFEWGCVYRGGDLVYLINGLTAVDLQDTSRFQPISPTRFRVEHATYLNGDYLYDGDQIRLEAPTVAALSTAARQLRVVANFSDQRLLFYRLGSRTAASCDTNLVVELAKILGS